MSDDDYTYVIKDKDGNVISDRFYACSSEAALRIAKHFYSSALTAERITYRG